MTLARVVTELALWAHVEATLRTPAYRALRALEARDLENARAALHDKAAEAALSGNPARARYYEDWAAR